MFWKKPSKPLNIDLDSADQREAYRIEIDHPGSTPPTIALPEGDIVVQEISAGGLTLIHTELKRGLILTAALTLPDIHCAAFDVTLEVMRVQDKHVVHCRFAGLSESERDKIHYFVLHQQKCHLDAQTPIM